MRSAISYGDAARYRLGVNHHQIPVNSPKAAKYVNSYHRDGAMRTAIRAVSVQTSSPLAQTTIQILPGSSNGWGERKGDTR